MVEVDYVPTSYLHLRRRQAIHALQRAGWSTLDIAIAFHASTRNIATTLKWEKDGSIGEPLLEYPLTHDERVPSPNLILSGEHVDDLEDAATPAMVEAAIDVLYRNADLGEGFDSESLREAIPLMYLAMKEVS